MNRRTLLKVLVHGQGLVMGAIIGIPLVLSAFSPLFRTRRLATWQAVGRLDEFAVDSVQQAVVQVPRDDRAESLREKAVYVWRPSDEEVVVFSRNCTDLSCPVTWDPGSRCFLCPCHGGIFATNGDRMAGPPQKPLYRYATRIRDHVLEIDLNSLPPMT